MEPAAYATYKLQVQGLFFLGLILGTVIAEVFFSGRLSDWLVMFLAKRNNGQRTPEMRLWMGYPAAVLSSLGLLIWGLSIDKEWHWITGQIAFFLCEWSGVEDEYMHRNVADACNVQLARACRLEIQRCRAISSTVITNMPWISSPFIRLSST
jgi:hypothetical protein